MTVLDRDVLAPARPTVLHVHLNETPGPYQAARFDELRFWLPVLGPTCCALLQTFAAGRSTSFDTADLAASVGVRSAQLWASLERLARFSVAAFAWVDVVVVRINLPALTGARLDRLPDHLRYEATLRQYSPEQVAS